MSMNNDAFPIIPFFKSGKHQDSSGAVIEFSENDLASTANAYDPAKHEAPLVVGHPTTDDPAWGWVSAVRHDPSTGELLADSTQVDSQFAEWVKEGRYPKRSASFYMPDSKANPVPGVYYLRHIGFLGAQAPALKGMRKILFSEESDGIVTVDFSSTTHEGSIVSDNTSSSSNKAADDDQSGKDSAERSAREWAEMVDKRNADFAERESALKVLEQALKQKERSLKSAELARFVEGLEGKVLPADKKGLVAFMESIDESVSIQFGEAASDKNSATEWFKGWLGRLPNSVEYKEFSASAGKTNDDQSSVNIEVARKARHYHNKMRDAGTPVSFSEAVDAVHKGAN